MQQFVYGIGSRCLLDRWPQFPYICRCSIFMPIDLTAWLMDVQLTNLVATTFVENFQNTHLTNPWQVEPDGMGQCPAGIIHLFWVYMDSLNWFRNDHRLICLSRPAYPTYAVWRQPKTLEEPLLAWMVLYWKLGSVDLWGRPTTESYNEPKTPRIINH